MSWNEFVSIYNASTDVLMNALNEYFSAKTYFLEIISFLFDGQGYRQESEPIAQVSKTLMQSLTMTDLIKVCYSNNFNTT